MEKKTYQHPMMKTYQRPAIRLSKMAGTLMCNMVSNQQQNNDSGTNDQVGDGNNLIKGRSLFDFDDDE